MKTLKALCRPRPSVFDPSKRDTVLDITDLIERLHDDVRARGGQQLGVILSGDADSSHRAGLGGLNPGGGVLHYDRGLGVDGELAGRGQEHLRVGLSVREVPPGDVRVEVLEQRQTGPQRRRGDAVLLGEGVEPDRRAPTDEFRKLGPSYMRSRRVWRREDRSSAPMSTVVQSEAVPVRAETAGGSEVGAPLILGFPDICSS